ncbi:HAD-IA family hydrolase [Rhizobium sp. EC-SD404]|uniref:HAD-IA family hydrolase n=1 Tax=Rhizobium sp. EC-SD404 TaxID=2038389 RepID=UPI0012549861|nr:HAD-IA family hydrolase [Rhizobium sp. EC-SD404]VVS99079.1 Phosphoglycolate phosphatase [Rhizobium sp. EC-SD404]
MTIAMDRTNTNGGRIAIVLFDLDGTLVDSAPDLAHAINLLMVESSLEPHALADVRGMIGHGIRRLVERAFAAHRIALSDDELTLQHDRMMDIYAEHLVHQTTLRPGAGEVIEELVRRGVTVSCVTNKPTGFSRTILAHFGILDVMNSVIGGDSGHARKPAPAMLLAAAAQAGFDPQDALLVGDSSADRAAADAAGMRCVLIADGYCDVPLEDLAPDAIIADFRALIPVMAALEEGVSA